MSKRRKKDETPATTPSLLPHDAGWAREVLAGARRTVVGHGDCVALMRELPDASVDAIVTDPPYDLIAGSRGGSGRSNEPDNPYGRHGAKGGGFMGLAWDATGVAFDPATWRAALRVLKPGGYLLAFGGSRTYHRMACAIEDAGFEIRDSLAWLYGQGFPKSLDVSKAIDAAAGAERPIIGAWTPTGTARIKGGQGGATAGRAGDLYATQEIRTELPITGPATDAAKEWEGWGTSLKPAFEPVVMARKPPSESTVAANVLAHGTGALHVDACRVGTTKEVPASVSNTHGVAYSTGLRSSTGAEDGHNPNVGRWPPNVLLVHNAGCVLRGTRRVRAAANWDGSHAGGGRRQGGFGDVGAPTGDAAPNAPGHADADGLEEIEDWICEENCPVAELDRQSGARPSGAMRPTERANRTGFAGPMPAVTTFAKAADVGGASRFFPTFRYCAKADRAERERGCEGLPKRFLATLGDGIGEREHNPGEAAAHVRNHHPTVKPLEISDG